MGVLGVASTSAAAAGPPPSGHPAAARSGSRREDTLQLSQAAAEQRPGTAAEMRPGTAATAGQQLAAGSPGSRRLGDCPGASAGMFEGTAYTPHGPGGLSMRDRAPSQPVAPLLCWPSSSSSGAGSDGRGAAAACGVGGVIPSKTKQELNELRSDLEVARAEGRAARALACRCGAVAGSLVGVAARAEGWARAAFACAGAALAYARSFT